MNAAVIDELVAAIAGRIAPPIPLDVDLWGAEESGLTSLGFEFEKGEA